MKKAKVWHSIKDFSIITFGAVLAAAAIYFFMLPSHVAVGSASALAMVLGNFIPLPVSMITLAINVFLLIMYSMSKINKDNPIDALKNENL